MPPIILSVLTPAVPSRLHQLTDLCAELGKQIDAGPFPVEHLVLLDNKKRTVGEKRDALLRAARGKYVAFVDDDDWVSFNYISELAVASSHSPDVITFLQEATVNGQTGTIEFRLGNSNEAWKPLSHGVIHRNAWHVCAWRRDLAIQSHFPASNYGEDWAFASRLCALPNLREIHIPEVLHYYRHDSKTTEAPPPK